MLNRRGWALGAVVLALITGCSKPPLGGPRHKTRPVTGTVEVNGEAAELVEVTFLPEPGTSEIKYPVVTMTDKE